VYDTGEDSTKDFAGHEITLPYIVMEYVKGRTLREFVSEDQPMGYGRAAQIMAPLLSALEYSHQQGIVHRDIKPGNVMITDDGDVKVMDFGIARAIADATGMTQTQAVMGTAQYLSPEQARGQLVDARSDIYSAACVLYELVTGRPPFTGDSPVSIAYQHVREDPQPPSAINPAITDPEDAVILTGLAKDRESRYASADAFAADVAAVAAGRAPVLAGAAAAAVSASSPADATTVLGTTTMLGVSDPDRTQAIPQGAAASPVATSSPAEPAPTPAPPAEGEEKSKKPVAVIVIVILALAAIAGATAWWFLGGGGSDVEVPELEGKTQQEAQQALEAVDLRARFTEQASTEVDEGTVISSDPGAGEKVDRASAVTVVVSSGPDAVEVPDLDGMTQSEAEDALEQAGLVADYQGSENVAKLEEGQVSRQDPEAKDSAKEGDSVQFWTASGSVEVPDLAGMTEDEATSKLEDLGLTAEVKTQEDDDTDKTGTVIDQNPTSGQTAISVGSEVTITIATKPSPVSVPNVTGLTQDEATEALEDHGFVVKTADEFSDTVEEGYAIRTDPGANEKVDKGSAVTLYVSNGKEQTEEPTTETPTESPTTETPTETTTTPDDDKGNGNG
jgi:serine/threonine-protein kinase